MSYIESDLLVFKRQKLDNKSDAVDMGDIVFHPGLGWQSANPADGQPRLFLKACGIKGCHFSAPASVLCVGCVLRAGGEKLHSEGKGVEGGVREVGLE